MATRGTRFLASDIWDAPDDGRIYEVIDGDLYVAPAPSWRHQWQLNRLNVRVSVWVEAHNLGYVVTAPTGIVLNDENGVEPDLIFVSHERAHLISERGVEGDRARALFDVETNTIVSAKDPRRYPGLLSLPLGLDEERYSQALGRAVKLVDSAPPGTLLRRQWGRRLLLTYAGLVLLYLASAVCLRLSFGIEGMTQTAPTASALSLNFTCVFAVLLLVATLMIAILRYFMLPHIVSRFR